MWFVFQNFKDLLIKSVFHLLKMDKKEFKVSPISHRKVFFFFQEDNRARCQPLFD